MDKTWTPPRNASRMLGIVTLLFLAPASLLGAEDDAGYAAEQAAAYADCMALAESEPDAGWERANAWLSEGGGNAAEHCAAVSLIGLGHPGEAAKRLEQLAAHLRKDHETLQTEILAQAAQAWLLADEVQRAYDVQSAALEQDPYDIELLVDRSLTAAAVNDYRSALDDLNRALRLDPKRPDILVYRASAKRFLDAPVAARADVDQALRLDPGNPEALLERGILHRLEGNDDAARADWLQVTLNAPDTETAAVAQSNLERLDFSPD